MNHIVFLFVFTLISILLGGVLLADKTHLPFEKSKGKALALLTFFPLVKFLKRSLYLRCSSIMLTLFWPSLSWAAEGIDVAGLGQPLDLTQHWAGYLSLIVFAVAYILAMTEGGD